jgi:hypothetical protein
VNETRDIRAILEEDAVKALVKETNIYTRLWRDLIAFSFYLLRLLSRSCVHYNLMNLKFQRRLCSFRAGIQFPS